jgi:tagatose 6-phosphate kinase
VIGVVCLNPALDVTHHVPVVDWAGVNRPRSVDTRPGGKGVNVARVLLALGAEVLLVGLAGGASGQALTAGLEELGVPARLTPIGGETRRTFAVLDEARETVAMFNEPGPLVQPAEFGEFLVSFKGLLEGAEAIVLSGSLPAGLPPDTYATLIATAGAAGAHFADNSRNSGPNNHSNLTSPSHISGHSSHANNTGEGGGVPVVLDASGEALRLGALAGPAVVKPNLAELEDLAGQPLSLAGDGTGRPSVASAAAELRAGGAGSVVVSLGPAGLYAETAAGRWRAVAPPVGAANPRGAGDAVTAGLVLGLVRGQPWPDRLRAAAALGTAAALAPVAGEFRPADYQQVLAGVTVSEMPPARYGSPEDPGHEDAEHEDAGHQDAGHDGCARPGNGGAG